MWEMARTKQSVVVESQLSEVTGLEEGTFSAGKSELKDIETAKSLANSRKQREKSMAGAQWAIGCPHPENGIE